MSKSVKKRSGAILAMSAAVLLAGCGRSTNQSAAITGNSLYGGCIPLNQELPFVATDAAVDMNRIEAGVMPQYGGRSIGRVELGGAVAGGTFQRASADGAIAMNIQPSYQNQGAQLPGSYQYGYGSGYSNGYGYGGSSTTATITGKLNLSQQARDRIQAAVGQYQNQQMYSPYTGGYGQSLPQTANTPYTVCVSGMAITMNYQGNALVGGYVYLYLNQSQYLIQQLTF